MTSAKNIFDLVIGDIMFIDHGIANNLSNNKKTYEFGEISSGFTLYWVEIKFTPYLHAKGISNCKLWLMYGCV